MQQHTAFGAQRCSSVLPTKLRPTLLVHRIWSFTQLLRWMLNTVCQYVLHMSTGTKPAHKLMAKLTLERGESLSLSPFPLLLTRLPQSKDGRYLASQTFWVKQKITISRRCAEMTHSVRTYVLNCVFEELTSLNTRIVAHTGTFVIGSYINARWQPCYLAHHQLD